MIYEDGKVLVIPAYDLFAAGNVPEVNSPKSESICRSKPFPIRCHRDTPHFVFMPEPRRAEAGDSPFRQRIAVNVQHGQFVCGGIWRNHAMCPCLRRPDRSEP